MKFWVQDKTLIIHGRFSALSSGVAGGWRNVDYLFNHTVEEDFERWHPAEYLKSIAERYSMKRYFGLLTSVPMEKLAVVSVDDVTVFATAGVENPNESLNVTKVTPVGSKTTLGTVNKIIVVESGMSDAAMVNAVITATEAKTSVLLELGYNFTGTSTDAVIVARELSNRSERYYEYAGPASVLGRKIWRAVRDAVRTSLQR